MSPVVRKWIQRAAAIALAPPVLIVLILMRWLVPMIAPIAARRRAAAGQWRSLWALTPILTLPLLAKADRLLGLKSDSLVYHTYYITRTFDLNISRPHAWITRIAPPLLRFFGEIVLLWTLCKYDVYHYFYDRGLMLPAGNFGIAQRELDWLERTGKRLYTYAYGADVRTRPATLALGEWNFCRDCNDPGRHCICDPVALERSIAPVERVARSMNAMGDMLTYVPNVRHMQHWPIDVDAVRATAGEGRRERPIGSLVLAHAPNHGHFKGTGYLEATVRKLQAEGLAIELRLVQGVPNAEVLRLFAQADVVIDQLIGGFHGYTALEAMALGKPVVSYVRSPDLVFPDCPIINATPDTIEQVLRNLLAGHHDLAELGHRGMYYVQKTSSIEAMALRLAQMYLRTGDPPSAVRARILVERSRLQQELARKIGALNEA